MITLLNRKVRLRICLSSTRVDENELCDCIDQLRVLIYQTSRLNVIGAELNEDLSCACTYVSNSLNCIQEQRQDFGLKYETSRNTYVNPRGVECSETGYFLYNCCKFQYVLLRLSVNTSDHHSVCMELSLQYTVKNVIEKVAVATKISWRRNIIEQYTRLTNGKVQDLIERKYPRHDIGAAAKF